MESGLVRRKASWSPLRSLGLSSESTDEGLSYADMKEKRRSFSEEGFNSNR